MRRHKWRCSGLDLKIFKLAFKLRDTPIDDPRGEYMFIVDREQTLFSLVDRFILIG